MLWPSPGYRTSSFGSSSTDGLKDLLRVLDAPGYPGLEEVLLEGALAALWSKPPRKPFTHRSAEVEGAFRGDLDILLVTLAEKSEDVIWHVAGVARTPFFRLRVAFPFRLLEWVLQRFIRVEVIRLNTSRTAVGALYLIFLRVNGGCACLVLREYGAAHRAHKLCVRHKVPPLSR